ncbi:MAG: WhiB family transcriptional regulator, redox-sensing transcriptional regulator [Oerskovia sp.]|jgi:WhiB family redox-sensing transcriptional regulator|nr:WhiB family transcriptional regulator, redox-sensing transcriptional regulator [Oerskovia sp.]
MTKAVYERPGLPFVDGRQACARADAELFFNPDGERGQEKHARNDAAKAVCRTCPLVHDCLAHALTNPEWGVWGATTEDERAALQRRHGMPRRVGPPRTAAAIQS